MSDAQTAVDTDDLKSFEDVFYGRTEVKAEEPVADNDEDSDITESEEDEVLDDDTVADEVDSEEEDGEETSEPEPKKKNRKSFQERIDELTAKSKEAERLREADRLEYQRRIQELESKTPTAKPEVEEKADDAPDFNAKDKDGNELYPLGEFDHAYIRDYTRWTIAQENKAAAAYRKEEEAKATVQAARAQAQAQWQEKLTAAEAELPDVRSKIATLESSLTGIDQSYGQYLVDVIMTLDNGPAVLHYLGDNPKEAREIVGSGYASATVRLGRLDALVAKAAKKEEAPKKVTRAPAPPVKTTRGIGGKFAVAQDTDDLDAFENLFYAK